MEFFPEVPWMGEQQDEGIPTDSVPWWAGVHLAPCSPRLCPPVPLPTHSRPLCCLLCLCLAGPPRLLAVPFLTRPCVLSGDLILHVGKSGSWHCEEGRILEMGGVADEYHEVGKAATCGPGN